MKRLPWFASFAMFIALCASAAYWALQLIQPPVRAVAATPQAEPPALSLDTAKGLFGGQATSALASNYQLKGVVAAAKSEDSVAILSADGKPAKAVATGGELTPGVTVREVHPQYVLLSESGVIKRVELAVRAAKSPTDAALPAKAQATVVPDTSSASPTTVVSGAPNGMPHGMPSPGQQATEPGPPSQPSGRGDLR